MSERTMAIDGVRVPRFLYGTAWKEDETERLTALALRQGFRGIDTANQRRHYHEAAVGRAVVAALSGLTTRDDLYLRQSSPSSPPSTTACPTTPVRRFGFRSSSHFPVRSSTWARSASTPMCSTVRPGTVA